MHNVTYALQMSNIINSIFKINTNCLLIYFRLVIINELTNSAVYVKIQQKRKQYCIIMHMWL